MYIELYDLKKLKQNHNHIIYIYIYGRVYIYIYIYIANISHDMNCKHIMRIFIVLCINKYMYYVLIECNLHKIVC